MNLQHLLGRELKNKGIYAAVVLEKKNGKEKLGIIPCNSGVFSRLVQVSGEEETYMLAEELINTR